MERVITLSDKIQEKSKVIKSSLRTNLEKSQTDPKAFALYLQQIDVACDQITEFTLSLFDQFHVAREFIHSSQSAVVQVVHLYQQTQVECEYLSKQLKLREGEIKALQEMRRARPGRMIASVANGPPPGFENQNGLNAANSAVNGGNTVNGGGGNMSGAVNGGGAQNGTVPQNQNESFQFDEIATDFMHFATQFDQFQVNSNNLNDALSPNPSLQGIQGMSTVGTGNTDQIVPKMAALLSKFKTKTVSVQRAVTEWSESGGGNRYNRFHDPEETQNALRSMLELVEDLNNNLIRAKQIMGPDAKYIGRLENRYVQIMGLYNMKYAEVEHKNDMLFQSDEYINSLKEDIGDLEYRLGAVMSSAVSNVETRMKAFNDFGIKVQTFEKVMQLIDDTQLNIHKACNDIQDSVDKDLFDIIGDSFDDKQHQDTSAMLGNVAHACDYILKAFDDIGQEFAGVREFVHPDREMVERLQTEMISMYENQVQCWTATVVVVMVVVVVWRF